MKNVRDEWETTAKCRMLKINMAKNKNSSKVGENMLIGFDFL